MPYIRATLRECLVLSTPVYAVIVILTSFWPQPCYISYGSAQSDVNIVITFVPKPLMQLFFFCCCFNKIKTDFCWDSQQGYTIWPNTGLSCTTKNTNQIHVQVMFEPPTAIILYIIITFHCSPAVAHVCWY